jgi:hypothetical protein
MNELKLNGRRKRILPNSSGIGPEYPSRFRTPGMGLLLSALLALVSMAAWSEEYEASGFVMRNYSPLSAIVGIPGRWPDGTDKMAEFSWNASSHSMAETGGTQELLLDGETHTLSARLQYRLTRRFQAGIDIPWISHSGGFMDGTIEAWHEFFGLPEGIRPFTPNNQLSYVFAANGTESLRFENSASGFGDIRLSGAFEAWGIDAPLDASYLRRMPLKLTFNVKVPTGDIDKLTGSGNTDLAAGLGVRSPRTPGARFNWWFDAGLVWPGDVDIAGLDTSGPIFYYDAARSWRLARPLDLLVQVAGNSPIYQAGINNIGRPVAQLGLGGLWHASKEFGLRFGFFEDIRSSSAPDFGFELTLIFSPSGKD